MRKSLLVIIFSIAVFTTTSAQQADAKMIKVTFADTSKNKSPFWKAFIANSPTDNSGQESYKRMKLDQATYTSTYLKASGIMPSSDAIALVQKLNPSLGDSVIYGTYLTLPELGKPDPDQSRELTRDLKEMNKYNRKDHQDFILQVKQFDTLYAGLGKIKLRFDTLIKDRQEFSIILDDLSRHMVKKVKLSKGRYSVMSKTLSIVIKVLEKCIEERTVIQNDVAILKVCSDELITSYTASFGNSSQKELQDMYAASKGSSDQRNFKVAALAGVNTEIDEDLPRAEYVDVNKTCYLYVLTTNAAGEIIELQHSFFYAYLCVADATWECYYNKCTGFKEENQDVSFSTLNMAVAHYVFRFRDKATGKVHWRCYKQDDFKIYDKNGRQLDKNEVMIIFNPGAEDCKNANWLQ